MKIISTNLFRFCCKKHQNFKTLSKIDLLHKKTRKLQNYNCTHQLFFSSKHTQLSKTNMKWWCKVGTIWLLNHYNVNSTWVTKIVFSLVISYCHKKYVVQQMHFLNNLGKYQIVHSAKHIWVNKKSVVIFIMDYGNPN